MASVCALDTRKVEVSNVRIGADYFIGKRDYTRTVLFPHPKGECCVCADDEGLKMKCGHFICPDDILDNAWQQIKNGKHKISCSSCIAIIDVDDIITYGLPEEEELQFLTTALSVNFCKTQDIQQCIKCKSYCQRHSSDNTQVTCTVCTRNMGRRYIFCWCCLQQWKIDPRNLENCGNINCNKAKLIQLESSEMIEFLDMKNNTVRVPRTRLCPECRTILQHNGDGCNEMTCDYCSYQFCFICLTPTEVGSLICRSTTWDDNAIITCRPAPIQNVRN